MRIGRIAAAAIAVAASFALAACSAGEPASTEGGKADTANADLTLTTVDGELALDAVPERVVVLDYASLDTLNAIGMGDVVVGTATKSLPESLQSFADVESVGTLKEPDFEAIASVDPDLILISNRLAEQEPQLAEIAPTANVAIDASDWLNSTTERALDLAAVFGKQDAAKEKVDAINSSAEELKAKAAEAGSTMIVMTSGGKLTDHGPGGRYDFVFSGLGFDAASEAMTDQETSGHGKEISFEYIGETNPDMMLVIDRDVAIGNDGDAAQQVLDNDIVNSSNAAKNDKIVYLDAANWYLVGGGLDSSQAIIDELTAAVSA